MRQLIEAGAVPAVPAALQYCAPVATSRRRVALNPKP